MKKCVQASEDPYLGLLNLRNTPTESIGTSPAQRLFCRRTRTLLPTVTALLEPSTQHSAITKAMIEDKRQQVADRYRSRTILKPLHQGQTVRIQPQGNAIGAKELWKEATVARQFNARSYEVVTENGATYTRNRAMLRAREPSRSFEGHHNPVPDMSPRKSDGVSGTPVRSSPKPSYVSKSPQSSLAPNLEISPTVTKSGRTVNPPAKLDL